MHETHLIKPIIKGIEQHALEEGAKKVTKIEIKIGELTGVTNESFSETFNVLAEGTLLENTELNLIFFPGTIIQVISFDIE